jgi:cell division protein FtsL
MTRLRKRGVAFYVLVAAGSAGVAALAHVWVRNQVVQLGYEIAREQKLAEQLTESNQQLRIEVDGLRNPARIQDLARRELHMVPPDPERIRLLRPSVAATPARSVKVAQQVSLEGR